MRAGELCVREVLTATTDESVIAAAQRMAEYGVGDLIVVAEQPSAPARPIGIVTDRDLVVHVLACPERPPGEIRVGDVMHAELVVAREGEDVEGVLARMRGAAIRRIPIVDADGALQGVLSLDDVIEWMGEQLQATVRTIDRQRPQGPSPMHRR